MDPSVTLLGVLQLYREGRLQDAIAVGRLLVAKEPANADAVGLLGMMLQQNGENAEALARLTEAVSLRPNGAALHLLRGIALRSMDGRDQEAITEFRQAIVLQAEFADAHLELGNMLKRLGRYAEAAASLREATRLAPNNAVAWLNLGVAQMELRLLTESIGSFRQAITLEPRWAEAQNVTGAALMEDGQVSSAQEAFSAALRLKPDYAAAHNNLARTFRAQGRHWEAITEFRAALAAGPDPGVHSNLCYTLNFVADLPPEELWREHQAWGQRWGNARVSAGAVVSASSAAGMGGATPSAPNATGGDGAPPFKSPAPTSRATGVVDGPRLRVGFVSPDLVNHAVAYFFEPLLAARDRGSWEAVCYSDTTVADATTVRLRSLADHWRDTASLKDEQLEALIRRDRIGILVDLAGHTAHNRLTVFARKPAPVQVTWLGYPNTTGLRAIDYRITDAITDPPGQTERWHAEQLLRLPRAFLCYLPPKDAPNVGPSPASAAKQITFASFSNFAKVSEPCLKTWAQILQKLAHSRLILKSRGLADAGTVARIQSQFAAYDIGPMRVILDGKLVSVPEHLRQYNAVDIALDPFPYNGTTTTCEALWMGVPVITLAGKAHVARVGASLLTNLGHADWIASTPDEYVSRAISLASDRVKLGEIRQDLRPEMQRSPLCDAKDFAANFTAALQTIWARYSENV